MARRKPSVTRMIKGFERMAHDAEARASSMRELGFPDYARSISTAANAFSDAAIMLARQLNQESDHGYSIRGPSVGEFYGVTLEELKARCRKAGDELIAERGEFLVYETPVYSWAKT